MRKLLAGLVIIAIIGSVFISSTNFGQTAEEPEIKTIYDLVKHCPTIETLGAWIDDNIKYTHDEEVWDKRDYWQSPEETLKLRTGDCEDYAILFWKCAKLLKTPTTVSGAIFYLRADKKAKKRAHAFTLVGYDDYTKTCIGIFDTARLEMFGKRKTVSEMMDDFKKIDWIKVYIFQKKNNDEYREYTGWRRKRIIRNKNRKPSKWLKL